MPKYPSTHVEIEVTRTVTVEVGHAPDGLYVEHVRWPKLELTDGEIAEACEQASEYRDSQEPLGDPN